jgi:hypothetical protein
MTKDERLKLNELSKKCYGSSSKWMKMVSKGERGPQVEVLEDGTERSYQGIVYYTEEEIGKMMEELIKEEEELRAAQEKEALEEKQKREESKQDVIKEILETVES